NPDFRIRHDAKARRYLLWAIASALRPLGYVRSSPIAEAISVAPDVVRTVAIESTPLPGTGLSAPRGLATLSGLQLETSQQAVDVPDILSGGSTSYTNVAASSAEGAWENQRQIRRNRLVPLAGLEPARCRHQQILSLPRLPIPPQGLGRGS